MPKYAEKEKFYTITERSRRTPHTGNKCSVLSKTSYRPFVPVYLRYILLLFTVCNHVETKGMATGREYSASHSWHGDRGALQCGVFCFPLGGDSFNLGVELDALEKNGQPR